MHRTTHADRCLLPIARVARSFSTFGRHYLRRNTRRQEPSAHRSCCSLIQRFRETLLAQNHTCRQAPSAHSSRCSLIQHFQETPLISLAQNHMHTERRHLPIARVARSFSALGRPSTESHTHTHTDTHTQTCLLYTSPSPRD